MDKLKSLGKRVRAAVGAAVRALTGGVPPLMALMRRSREEEVAVGYNMIATCLIAGVIMAVAKPLADWLTGGMLTNPNVPSELTTMIGRVFDLVMYLGVVILVIGLIMAGINMARRPALPKKQSL